LTAKLTAVFDGLPICGRADLAAQRSPDPSAGAAVEALAAGRAFGG
jgi:hypothetical protein